MPTFTLPLATAMEAFSSVAPFRTPKSDRDVHPILGSVRLTPGMIVATDRYAAARYSHDTITGDDELLVPADAVDWIAALKRTTMRDAKIPAPTMRDGEGGHAADNYTLTITSETDAKSGADEITLALTSAVRDTVERSQSFDPCTAKNFPPLQKLFPENIDDDAAHAAPLAENGFTLAHFQLERLAKIAKLYGTRTTSVHTRPFAKAPLTKHQRTTPIYWRILDDGANTPLDGIVQPLLHG